MLGCSIVFVSMFVSQAAGSAANKLTPQEIADGWILLFDGGSTFGWMIDGEVMVANGVLTLGGQKETSATTTTQFCDGNLRFAWRAQGKEPSVILLESQKENWAPLLEAEISGIAWATASICIRGGMMEEFTRAGLTQKIRSYSPPTRDVRGRTLMGLARNRFIVRVPAGSQLTLWNMRFQPNRSGSTGLKPLFNGKDLTGWKQMPHRDPKRNSVYSVTKEGWLNVKDGPGDLQTTGEYDDFVLQLDVISNGTHLNSGVFFRAIPGQFWSGYESQIRNQWEGNDRTKPVDFGTGAIYRRQAARKVVPSDREWFTKTIIAHGPHMAVWVNGIQVTDFTDTRPDSANARQGRKLGKGPISLQGHDPTTDLSFRNIRLVALPKE